MYEKFHSPALGGFAVISHWVPFLLLAGYSGALADRIDIRRLIQVGMLMLLAVSVGWGIMFVRAIRRRCGRPCCCWWCTDWPAWSGYPHRRC